MLITEPNPTVKDIRSSQQGGTGRDRCARCGGLMVEEPCTDFWDDAGNATVSRCVQCGEVIDPVILKNRQGTGGR